MIVGIVKYQVRDYLKGHAKMLTLKFYCIMIYRVIFISEFENHACHCNRHKTNPAGHTRNRAGQ